MPPMPGGVTSANRADAPFPLNNLPYGVFSTPGTGPRRGVAVGDMGHPARPPRRAAAFWNAHGGTEPLTLPGGSHRAFLEGGDKITLTGEARGEGSSIGFGPCAGTIRPARP